MDDEPHFYKMNEHLSTGAVNRSLQLFYSYLNNNIATKGNRFAGFVLDIANPRSSGRMGIGATSLGLSMYSAIQPNDRRHVTEMERFILSERLPNGSWTISALQPYNVSLIYTTCYVLQSLARSGQQSNIQVLQDGLTWLTTIVNDDGGWGFTENSPSHIHPTSEVLFFFSLLKWTVNPSVFLKAREWLLNQRVATTYWVNDEGQPSHYLTALAYRGLISNSNYQNELERTRKWLSQHLLNAPCREEARYYIQADDHHIIEPISCFTRATMFEALASNVFTDFEPSIEREAMRLFRAQNLLGYWQCDNSSTQVPIYLNYHICMGLVNYENYLKRRPRLLWLNDHRRFFLHYPFSAGALIVLAIIGAIYTGSHASIGVNWIGTKIGEVNTYFQDLSGIANLFQITGISTLAILAFLYRFLIRKSD